MGHKDQRDDLKEKGTNRAVSIAQSVREILLIDILM
jgi:hypothetical protein